MKNISHLFSQVYAPFKAIVFYKLMSGTDQFYVESYDMGADGKPLNAEPLTETDAVSLAGALQTPETPSGSWLIPEGIIPGNVLYLSPLNGGKVIWYTPPAKAGLRFTKNLGLLDGQASVPGLVWKATLTDLNIYAVVGNRQPVLNTQLYHAPFFNIYQTGAVCMGNVATGQPARSLEHFMARWQNEFWNSAFSHTINGVSPVKGDLIALWKELIDRQATFPTKKLIKCNRILQNILT